MQRTPAILFTLQRYVALIPFLIVLELTRNLDLYPTQPRLPVLARMPA